MSTKETNLFSISELQHNSKAAAVYSDQLQVIDASFAQHKSIYEPMLDYIVRDSNTEESGQPHCGYKGGRRHER
jgi:hypothetical protein